MLPQLVLSDAQGNIFVHPTLKMAASDGCSLVVPGRGSMLPLAKDSTLFFMPGHRAVARDEKHGIFVTVHEFEGRAVFPVSGFVVPGFTRVFLPAAQKLDHQVSLPLWPYTAVGWKNGRFYACVTKIDSLRRQRPFYYSDLSLMKKNILKVQHAFASNRLFNHLARCAVQYNCRNAQNLFFKRWEAPLPTSPSCNARCLGCLSYQESDGPEASHERITFVPTAQEVFEVAYQHLQYARDPMVSFGQGCEGEPMLQVELLRDSITRIRRVTQKGTIHMNTNGFNPGYIKRLAQCGLNSVRISLNSLNEARYNAYYKPCGYKFRDVLDSIRQAKKSGLFVSLNYLTFPGFTDDIEEVGLLLRFLKSGVVDYLQLRNLSIDPEFFLQHMPCPQGKPLGMSRMIARIRASCPKVRLGYFNLSKNKFML